MVVLTDHGDNKMKTVLMSTSCGVGSGGALRMLIWWERRLPAELHNTASRRITLWLRATINFGSTVCKAVPGAQCGHSGKRENLVHPDLGMKNNQKIPEFVKGIPGRSYQCRHRTMISIFSMATVLDNYLYCV